MKFLVFNVMVAVALYSIIRGGPASEGVREAVEQIATVAAPVISAGAGMVEEPRENSRSAAMRSRLLSLRWQLDHCRPPWRPPWRPWARRSWSRSFRWCRR